MSDEHGGLETLSPEECLELLTFKSFVGRVAFVVEGGHPIILPVNYVVDKGSVVFSTAPGTKLSYLADGAFVAFEVDSHRPLYHTGWSVLVQGTAREVTDPGEVDLLQRGPLESWAVPTASHWIRVSIDDISGRRIPEA